MRRLLLALLVLVVAGASAGAWWWFAPPPAEPPLEPVWTASVATLAGNGVSGNLNGSAGAASFSDPFGVAVGADGTIYVSDAGDSRSIRAISRSGEVTTVAQGFETPSGIAVDPDGGILVADTGSNSIKRIAPGGQVTTIATGFNGPVGIAVDTSGRVVVADTYNDRVCIVERDGTIRTLQTSATFDTPSGVAVDASGTIYVADTGSSTIQTVSPDGASAIIELLSDSLHHPIGIAVGGGEIYVTDESGRILEVQRSGVSRVLAGSSSGFADGAGPGARFRRPSGLALAGPATLVVADTGNALVRLVEPQSRRGARPPPPPLIDPRFDFDAFAMQPLLWPIAPMDGPYEIAGTHGEARGGEGADRFHAGIDIRAEAGTPVRAVRDGFVSSPVSTGDFLALSEWLRIGSTAYVHVRAGRDGRSRLLDADRFVPTYNERGTMSRVRVRRGARFRAGDIIGSVNLFNHVHLNVGWPGEEINPLRLRLPLYDDTIPPTIARNGIQLFDEAGHKIPRQKDGRFVVSGHVQVVVDAWDQADGNRPQRRLGLYELGYGVLNADGSPAAGVVSRPTTIRFDRLVSGSDAPRLVYAPGSGIPFYGRRVTRFLYIVTNSFTNGAAASGVLDLSPLAPGDYTLRIRAADARGNEALANRDVRLTVPAPGH